MSISHWWAAPADLARTRLVLSPGGARRGWILRCAVVVVALVTGAAGSHFYWTERLGHLQEQTVALKDLQRAEQQLEQTRLQLRLSEAHSEELERQIDGLNQRLHKSQEELAFFRRARDGRP
jgi:uncharacterized protein HemX